VTGTAFSLLMPVYAGDHPEFLRRAFSSTVQEQHRPPAEVVMVRDGPVPDELDRCLHEIAESSPVPVHLVELRVNRGLGAALREGLDACVHEVVARMDADDVSLPHRFRLQLPVVEGGVDLVGSALREFADDDLRTLAVRVPPLSEGEIRAVARFRSPFNHPTVVYRRSAVRRAGGYRELPLLEDYWLFTRMIAAGARVANLEEPLVCYRVNDGAYVRRGGWPLLRSELVLQRRLRAEGFTTSSQYMRNVVIRGGYRLVPVPVRRVAYRRVFTRAGARP
jgi:glycosyltransferase involved in cell wall biosynthesis